MPDYDLTQWHDIEGVTGTFRERFDPEAVEGVAFKGALRFKIIRETWNMNAEPPERTIHEIELI